MTREEFIKQRCEIDKITEEEFEKRYRVVKCNCGQPYCKGYRCLDLDGLLKENQELKKLNEEKTKIGVANHKYASQCEDKVIIMEAQQKKFIKYLEDMLDDENDIFSVVRVKDVLQKYKEIIGVSDENTIK
jgi:hypothetical protein